MAIEKTEKITRDAFLWLVGAGAFAITLASTLLYVDQRLTTSTADHDEAVLLQRLRTAQAEVDTGSVDPRQIDTTTVTRRLSELEKE